MLMTSLSCRNLSVPTWETSGYRQRHRRIDVSSATICGSFFTAGINSIVVNAHSHLVGSRRSKRFFYSIGGPGATSTYPDRISMSHLSFAIRPEIVASSESPSYTDMRPKASLQQKGSSSSSLHLDSSSKILNNVKSRTPILQTYSSEFGHPMCRSIAVIGATGELAGRKIFPALFALYYSGFLPDNFGIFGYSRKNMTDEDLRSMVASTLTCRIDHQKNCEDQIDGFLRRTYYVNGGYNNREGMPKLAAQMEQVEGLLGASRIFYLSVPQDALLDVASSVADLAQSETGWNRVIIEKPFGYDSLSSDQFTKFIRSKFEENQLYRTDHLLGRNTIENLAVLRFSNLVFMPLWNQHYIDNLKVIWSDDFSTYTQSRYLDGNGIIGPLSHAPDYCFARYGTTNYS